ncbi:MAG: DUF3488 and DUF4129 domain-containing transglutaminase family protein [Ilumatobacteraceae bacterium]
MTASRPADVEIVSTLALMGVGVATAASFARVFPDWSFLTATVTAVVVTHLVAAALRAVRTPGWLAVPTTVTVMTWVLAALHHRDTLQAGVPTKATFDAFRDDITFVLSEFPTAVAPVASDGSFGTAAGIALVTAVILADVFAFRALGQVEAVVPPAAVMVIVSAVGTDRLRMPLAVVWVVAALVAIGMLRHRARLTDLPWMGARQLGVARATIGVVATVAIAAGVAIFAGPRLPGAGAAPLIDTRNRVPGVTEVVSPLVDIRSRLTEQSNAEMFVVASSDGPHYWRLLSLPVFDGSAWQPPEEDLVDEITVGLGGRPSRAEITISGLGGPLVPAPYRPVRVDGEVLWAADSESLVRTGRGLEAGDIVMVEAEIPTVAPDVLEGATWGAPPSRTYVSIPAGLPTSLVDGLVESGAVSATNAYDAARAVQTWFRTAFTYDTAVDLTDSASAIDDFLEIRRGFCQQFAGTFAVMMRMLGIPARVAVGFTPGDLIAVPSGDETASRYKVLGRHAHAWPEVWFDGVGWVAFEPTPGRGSPDGEGYLGIPAQQDETGAPATSIPVTTVTPSTTVRPDDPPVSLPATTVPSSTDDREASSRLPAVVMFGLLAASLLAAWVLVAPAVVSSLHQRRRRRWSERQRVVAAWRRASRSLELLGTRPTAVDTPLDVAADVVRHSTLDPRPVSELADLVNRAVYAPTAPSTTDAARSEALGDEIARHCSERLGTVPRLTCRLRPWTLHPSGGERRQSSLR